MPMTQRTKITFGGVEYLNHLTKSSDREAWANDATYLETDWFAVREDGTIGLAFSEYAQRERTVIYFRAKDELDAHRLHLLFLEHEKEAEAKSLS